jgi:hypothetical protein
MAAEGPKVNTSFKFKEHWEARRRRGLTLFRVHGGLLGFKFADGYCNQSQSDGIVDRFLGGVGSSPSLCLAVCISG